MSTRSEVNRRFVNLMLVLDRSTSLSLSNSCAPLKSAATEFAKAFMNGTDNLGLVQMCKAIAPYAAIVATANDEQHEQELRSEGAAFVARPYDLMGASLATFIERTVNA